MQPQPSQPQPQARTTNRMRLEDRPSGILDTTLDRAPLKALVDIVMQRRATESFTSAPVPDDVLESVLKLGLQSPSGFNLQPWRFIVVRSDEGRARLKDAALGQDKLLQAPVVIIAVGLTRGWSDTAELIFRAGAAYGAGDPSTIEQDVKKAEAFLAKQDMRVWVTRHTMIAVTTMMYAAEAYGFDTAPIEGFDAARVKREFSIPDEGEVVAMLALGRAEPPFKQAPGRFTMESVVYQEKFGRQR